MHCATADSNQLNAGGLQNPAGYLTCSERWGAWYFERHIWGLWENMCMLEWE